MRLGERGRVALSECCGGEIKPRFLHYATRHAKGACRKKPGRSCRDGRISYARFVLEVILNRQQAGRRFGGER